MTSVSRRARRSGPGLPGTGEDQLQQRLVTDPGGPHPERSGQSRTKPDLPRPPTSVITEAELRGRREGLTENTGQGEKSFATANK